MPVERVGQAEVGGCTQRVQKARLIFGLGYRKALMGTGWAISLLLCMNQLRKQPSGLVGPPFLTMMLFAWSAWAIHWPKVMTIESSLMSGCGLSHKSAENGCKSSWVKF